MSSARRRARAGGVVQRRRSRSTGVDEIPAELMDPDHAVWPDVDLIEELADVYGVDYIEPESSMLRDPYFERFKAFRRAYAERYGFMSKDYANTLDHRRLKAAGIYHGSRGPRYRMTSDGEVLPVGTQQRP